MKCILINFAQFEAFVRVCECPSATPYFSPSSLGCVCQCLHKYLIDQINFNELTLQHRHDTNGHRAQKDGPGYGFSLFNARHKQINLFIIGEDKTLPCLLANYL